MNKKLFVFDLDFTLWNAGDTWCDGTNPPYGKNNGEIYDSAGRWIRLYPSVLELLQSIRNSGKSIAAASRTYRPDWACELLLFFQMDHFFDRKEIYPGSKVRHFGNIQNFFKFNYNEMVFYDDEYRNIEEVGNLGVQCILVENGITMDLVEPYL
jgi:magnesium-dependent phosphatase 1